MRIYQLLLILPLLWPSGADDLNDLGFETVHVHHKIFDSDQQLAEMMGVKFPVLLPEPFTTSTTETPLIRSTKSPSSTTQFDSTSSVTANVTISTILPTSSTPNGLKTTTTEKGQREVSDRISMSSTSSAQNERSIPVAPFTTTTMPSSSAPLSTSFSTESTSISSPITSTPQDHTALPDSSTSSLTTTTSSLITTSTPQDYTALSDSSSSSQVSSSISTYTTPNSSSTTSAELDSFEEDTSETESTTALANDLMPTTNTQTEYSGSGSEESSDVSTRNKGRRLSKSTVHFNCKRGTYCEMKLTRENSNITKRMLSFMLSFLNGTDNFASHTGRNTLTGVPMSSGAHKYEMQHRKTKRSITIDVSDYPAYNHVITIVLCFPKAHPMMFPNTKTVFLKRLSSALRLPIEAFTLLSIQQRYPNYTFVELFDNSLEASICEQEKIKRLVEIMNGEKFWEEMSPDFAVHSVYANGRAQCAQEFRPIAAKLTNTEESFWTGRFWTDMFPFYVVLLSVIVFICIPCCGYCIVRKTNGDRDNEDYEELPREAPRHRELVHYRPRAIGFLPGNIFYSWNGDDVFQ